MRTVGFFAVILGLTLFSTPIPAAPLESGTPPAPPQAQGQSAAGELSITPVTRPPAGQILADRNANGLSDGLETLLETRGGDDPVDVIVTFSGSGNAASAQQAVGPFTVYRAFSLISGFAATMTANQARGLARTAGVFRVESDATAYASLEGSRRDFGVDGLLDPVDPAIQLPSGAGIKVCVLDTGVQRTHEQFTYDADPLDGVPPVSRVIGFTDLVGDYDGNFWNGADVAYDDHGHGTHVSGIIAGDGTASTGEDGADPFLAPLMRGVAPGVSLLVAKVLNYNGSGPDSGIIVGLQWCIDQGADVANLSLGIAGSSDGQDAFSQAVNAAVEIHGLIVVVAAGNSGDGEKTIGSPGAADRALTVAAVAEHSPSTLAGEPVDPSSLGVYPAPFSSRGPTADDRMKPDIAAPGVSVSSAMTNVISADPDPIFGGGGGNIDLGCGVGCYTIKSGTSMATPFVAGAAALILAADSNLTPVEVRQVLADTARERGPVGVDTVFGHGLIDVAAAVAVVQGAGGPATEYPHSTFLRASVADNSVVQIPITVVDMTKPLAVTVSIDGQLTSFGWSPDIDMYLLDEFGQPFLVLNPLYPWFGAEYIAAPGTSSTCPAGEDCGGIGIQETIHIGPLAGPWAQRFILEFQPWGEFPNNGKGGSFSIELSNGYFESSSTNKPLVADAGPDVTVPDDGGDGFEEVTLDGRATLGLATSYQWKDADGAVYADGAVAKITLPVGANTVELHVQGGTDSDIDTVVVTVGASSGGGKGGGKGGGNNGGGKGGGGDGGGKPCNPKKETCP